STDVRSYMRALESAGIPCVVRAGPDLFSQPEVLFFVSALAITAGCETFYGAAHNQKCLPNRIEHVLGCPLEPTKEPNLIKVRPEPTLRAAARMLRHTGLSFDRAVEDRVLAAAQGIALRIRDAHSLTVTQAAVFRTPRLRDFLTGRNQLRRVFPQ